MGVGKNPKTLGYFYENSDLNANKATSETLVHYQRADTGEPLCHFG